MKKKIFVGIIALALIYFIKTIALPILLVSYWNQVATDVKVENVRNFENRIEIDVKLKAKNSGRICGFHITFPEEWVSLTNPATCNPPGSCTPLDTNYNGQHTFIFSKKDPSPESVPYDNTYINMSFYGLTECKFELGSKKINIKDFILNPTHK